jgi:hypothetical protein
VLVEAGTTVVSVVLAKYRRPVAAELIAAKDSVLKNAPPPVNKVKPLESFNCAAVGIEHGSQRAGEAFDDVPDRLASPETIPVVERSECAAVHPVDVERPSQMINFVLEYPGVPSRSFDRLWFSMFI